MVATIGLAGRGRMIHLATFAAAASFGGVVIAATFWTAFAVWEAVFPWPTRNAAAPILAIVAVIFISMEHWDVPRWIRPFGPSRQVSSLTMHTRGARRAAVNWGFQLGFGAITRVNSWAFWAFLTAGAVIERPSLALLNGFIYGLLRGLQPLITPRRPNGGSVALRLAELDRRYPAGLALVITIAAATLVA